MRTILFLCTGNYYRSRFAEHYFNHLARQVSLPWLAISRGLATERGVNNVGPISPFTRQALDRLDVRIPSQWRFPRQLDEYDLLIADLVIAVKETEHRPLMQERFSGWERNIAYWRIHDLDYASAEESLPLLQARVDQLFNKLVMMVHLSTMGTGQISSSIAETDVGSGEYRTSVIEPDDDFSSEGAPAACAPGG